MGGEANSGHPPDGTGREGPSREALATAVDSWLEGGLRKGAKALRDAVNAILLSASRRLAEDDYVGKFRAVRDLGECFRAQTHSLRKEIAAVDRLFEKSELRSADAELQRLLGESDRLRLKRLIHALGDPSLQKAVKEAGARWLEATIVDAVENGKVSRLRPLSRSIGYGMGLNERSVEIPLALEFARLRDPGLVLDAGASLNLACVRRLVPEPAARTIHVTLTGDAECPLFSGDRFSYVFGDLRKLDFQDGVFDRVVCVSTIEHIGMDNSRYGGAREGAPGSALDALREMLRVLRPGGGLLLTFPYGRPLDHGWFRVFGDEDVDRLRKASEPNEFEWRRYLYDRGWFEAPGGEPVPEVPEDDPETVRGLGVVVITKTGSAGDRPA